MQPNCWWSKVNFVEVYQKRAPPLPHTHTHTYTHFLWKKADQTPKMWPCKYNQIGLQILVYLSMSTCFWRLWAHHQEEQLCSCDTWYWLFCTDDCLVCRVATLHTRQSFIQNNQCQMSHEHSCSSWWWAHRRPKHVEIDRYKKNVHQVVFI